MMISIIYSVLHSTHDLSYMFFRRTPRKIKILDMHTDIVKTVLKHVGKFAYSKMCTEM